MTKVKDPLSLIEKINKSRKGNAIVLSDGEYKTPKERASIKLYNSTLCIVIKPARILKGKCYAGMCYTYIDKKQFFLTFQPNQVEQVSSQ